MMLIGDFNIDPFISKPGGSKLKKAFIAYLKSHDFTDIYKYIRHDNTPTWTNRTTSSRIDLAFTTNNILTSFLFSYVNDAIKAFYSTDHRILNVLFKNKFIISKIAEDKLNRGISVPTEINMLSILKHKVTPDFWNSYKQNINNILRE